MKLKSELAKAEADLQKMFAEIDAMEHQLAKQKRKVAVLRELSDESELSSPSMGLVSGITDACRTILRSAEKPLPPTEVAERVKRLGIPEQKNLLASIHTILKRLIAAGDITQIDDGRYVWVTLGERLRKAERDKK
jgi:hypothetical protein